MMSVRLDAMTKASNDSKMNNQLIEKMYGCSQVLPMSLSIVFDCQDRCPDVMGDVSQPGHGVKLLSVVKNFACTRPSLCKIKETPHSEMQDQICKTVENVNN